MDNQIKNLKELKGKNISDVVSSYGDLYFKFDDNTFAVLIPKDITEGFGYTKTEVNIEDFPIDKTNGSLVDIGIISKEEYLEALEQEEKIEKEIEEKREKEYQERLKKHELEQLKSLKQKYE